MWDLPGPGIKPMSPALAGGFFTTQPPGKPRPGDLNNRNLFFFTILEHGSLKSMCLWVGFCWVCSSWLVEGATGCVLTHLLKDTVLWDLWPHLTLITCLKGFPGGSRRTQWHPTPVLLPGKSHGWRSLVGCSPWGIEESDATEQLHFHFSLSCTGEGNGNPLRCSCLENPRDGGRGAPCGLLSLGSHRVGHNWSDLAAAAAGGSDGKESSCNERDWVQSLGWEDPLEKGMVTHSSILAWRIPWTEDPGRLQSMGSQWVGHGFHFHLKALSPPQGFSWWLSGKESAHNAEDTGDLGLIPGSRRSPEWGNGNSLQYS